MFENFRKSLEEVDANGDTAVYDSLAVAKGILVDYRPDLPNLRKRIIIVSDGDDTCSKSPAYEVCADLQAKKIIVDSVQVGTKHSGMLHAISVATGKRLINFFEVVYFEKDSTSIKVAIDSSLRRHSEMRSVYLCGSSTIRLLPETTNFLSLYLGPRNNAQLS